MPPRPAVSPEVTSAPAGSTAPSDIVAAVVHVLGPADLAGARVVVSAGGTREPIGAVHVIANRSSGKQGYAIAAEASARRRGHARIDRRPPRPAGVVVERVETAAEMQSAVERLAADADVVVMAAAVADFRPKAPADGKLKRRRPGDHPRTNPRHPGRARRSQAPRPVLVGFAAETADLVGQAQEKLRAKRLDFVVANDVPVHLASVSGDTGAVTIVRPG